jgi:hypothetical protein
MSLAQQPGITIANFRKNTFRNTTDEVTGYCMTGDWHIFKQVLLKPREWWTVVCTTNTWQQKEVRIYWYLVSFQQAINSTDKEAVSFKMSKIWGGENMESCRKIMHKYTEFCARHRQYQTSICVPHIRGIRQGLVWVPNYLIILAIILHNVLMQKGCTLW